MRSADPSSEERLAVCSGVFHSRPKIQVIHGCRLEDPRGTRLVQVPPFTRQGYSRRRDNTESGEGLSYPLTEIPYTFKMSGVVALTAKPE